VDGCSSGACNISVFRVQFGRCMQKMPAPLVPLTTSFFRPAQSAEERQKYPYNSRQRRGIIVGHRPRLMPEVAISRPAVCKQMRKDELLICPSSSITRHLFTSRDNQVSCVCGILCMCSTADDHLHIADRLSRMTYQVPCFPFVGQASFSSRGT
jgi:hypothetical protein